MGKDQKNTEKKETLYKEKKIFFFFFFKNIVCIINYIGFVNFSVSYRRGDFFESFHREMRYVIILINKEKITK